ncbi:hypothetical protein [Myxococcus sp. Y35]|uniref:hypothetical protein n=1 Tax=Pseudomyxococcus flavus TaxID=3115648 RepID=UPI003CF3CD79
MKHAPPPTPLGNARGARPHVTRWVGAAAASANTVIYLVILFRELHDAGSGPLLERARMFTDEIPAPINHWTALLNLPAYLSATVALGLIDDRASLAAVVAPQLTFVVVSSLQTALIAMGICRLLQAGHALWLRHRAID